MYYVDRPVSEIARTSSGGGFFAEPADPTQRRYEALRAYLLEGRLAAEVAEAFGYTTETLNSIVRDFRAGRREFFVSSRPGTKRAREGARARPDRGAALGGALDRRDRAGARTRGDVTEWHRDRGGDRRGRVRAAVARPEVLRGAPDASSCRALV